MSVKIPPTLSNTSPGVLHFPPFLKYIFPPPTPRVSSNFPMTGRSRLSVIYMSSFPELGLSGSPHVIEIPGSSHLGMGESGMSIGMEPGGCPIVRLPNPS